MTAASCCSSSRSGTTGRTPGRLFGDGRPGAAAMFVLELARHTPKPDNIPFEPEVRSLREGTGVGLRIQLATNEPSTRT